MDRDAESTELIIGERMPNFRSTFGMYKMEHTFHPWPLGNITKWAYHKNKKTFLPIRRAYVPLACGKDGWTCSSSRTCSSRTWRNGSSQVPRAAAGTLQPAAPAFRRRQWRVAAIALPKAWEGGWTCIWTRTCTCRIWDSRSSRAPRDAANGLPAPAPLRQRHAVKLR